MIVAHRYYEIMRFISLEFIDNEAKAKAKQNFGCELNRENDKPFDVKQRLIYRGNQKAKWYEMV